MTIDLNLAIVCCRRHLNIRGKSANLPAITERDWLDIKFGVDVGVDYYALSFVRNADVIYELKRWLSQQGKFSLSPYARAQLMREALLQSIEHVLRRTSLRCFNEDMEYVWMYCIQIRSNQDPVSHAFPPLRAQVSPVLAYYSAR